MRNPRNPVNPPTADYGPGHPFTGAPIVSAYSRAQAIDDGILVDVTELAKGEGFRWPVAMTLTAFNRTTGGGDDNAGTILRELLHLAVTIIRAAKPASDRFHFRFSGVALYAHAGPGDRGEPVITIMLEGED